MDFRLGELSVPVDEDANAALQAARHRDLAGAHQGHIRPAHLAGGPGRVSRAQVVGEGEERESASSPSSQATEPSNVAPAQQPDRLYRYPVISRVAAGAWQEAIEACDPWAYDTFELADYLAKGPAFWLQVSGDSMTSPVPPSIPEGHLILVDTGIEPRPGDMVVAKLVDADEATFKLLVADAEGMSVLVTTVTTTSAALVGHRLQHLLELVLLLLQDLLGLGFALGDLARLLDVFTAANGLAHRQAFAWEIVAVSGHSVASSAGITVRRRRSS